MLPARTSPAGSSQSQDTPPASYAVNGYLDDGFGVHYDGMYVQQPQVHHQPQQAHQQAQIHQQAQAHQQQSHQVHQHQHQQHQSQPSPTAQSMYQYASGMATVPQQSQSQQQPQQAYFASNTVPFPSYVSMHPPMIANGPSIDPSGVLVMAQSSMPGTPQEHRQSFSSDGSNYYGSGAPKETKSHSQEPPENTAFNGHAYGHTDQNKAQPHMVDNIAGQSSSWPDPAYPTQMGQPQPQWDGYTSYYKS